MENNKKVVSFSEKIKKIEKGEGILNLEQDDMDKGFPHKCKKCNNDFADVVDLGISYSDEAGVFLFKCKKCGNVERDAFGTGNK